MSEYVVQFSELKEDRETFEFLLEDSFFKVFQSSEWENGRIKVIVIARKRFDGITFEFSLNGELKVRCDRCLEAFSLHVNIDDRLFVKYGQKDKELDDDVVFVSPDENQIDLSQFLYEYLVLSIPVKKVHPVDERGNTVCNMGMIEKLKKHIVSEESEEIDPRWNDLKKLFDKN